MSDDPILLAKNALTETISKINKNTKLALEILEKLREFFKIAYDTGIMGYRKYNIIPYEIEVEPERGEVRYYKKIGRYGTEISEHSSPEEIVSCAVRMVDAAIRMLDRARKMSQNTDIYGKLRNKLVQAIPFEDIRKSLLDIDRTEKILLEHVNIIDAVKEEIRRFGALIVSYIDILAPVLPEYGYNEDGERIDIREATLIPLTKRPRYGSLPDQYFLYNKRTREIVIYIYGKGLLKELVGAPLGDVDKALKNIVRLSQEIEKLVDKINTALTSLRHVKLTDTVYNALKGLSRYIDKVAEEKAKTKSKEIIRRLEEKILQLESYASKLEREKQKLLRELAELKERQVVQEKREKPVEVPPTTTVVRLKLVRKGKSTARYKVYGVKRAGITNPLEYKVVINGREYSVRTDGKDFAVTIDADIAVFKEKYGKVDHKSKKIIVG